jgi:hypothetical protein
MSESLEFVEAEHWPICPHCDETIKTIEYTREKLSFGFLAGFTWVIVLACPECHKVLGTQASG